MLRGDAGVCVGNPVWLGSFPDSIDPASPLVISSMQCCFKYWNSIKLVLFFVFFH